MDSFDLDDNDDDDDGGGGGDGDDQSEDVKIEKSYIQFSYLLAFLGTWVKYALLCKFQ